MRGAATDKENTMSQVTIDPAIADSFAALAADPRVQQALACVAEDASATLAEQKTLAMIPAPTFAEGERAAYLKERFVEYGLVDLRIDAVGNVIARRPGCGDGPTLVLSAHMDTVYPAGTDLSVCELDDGRLQGAGIADDARGLAEVLAIGRALKADPKILLLDEPSLGLAPILVKSIFDTVKEINKSGVTVILVEQNAKAALKLANRGYVMEVGNIVLSDTAANLLKNEQVQQAYLGGGHGK